MNTFANEETLEQAVLEWLRGLGYQTAYGPDIGPNGSAPERPSYKDVILEDRLRTALARINPGIPADRIEAAVRTITRSEGGTLIEENRRFHSFVTDGIDIEYTGPDGRPTHGKVWLFDFNNTDNNDWLAVNQFTIIDRATGKAFSDARPDVVVFINGLPLAVIELKNPADTQANIRKAYNQLQTYKLKCPDLFTTNELLVAADGGEARVGTISSDWERFQPWKTIDGNGLAPTSLFQTEVLLRGLFDKSRLLDVIRGFVVFDDGPDALVKKAAAYHQYHAVKKAVERTTAAVQVGMDRRIGVVWHTQGSGKSLTMVFYAGQLIAHQALQNPTIVLLTDRNDLDDQLFGTFTACRELVRQEPQRATTRAELRKLLSVAAGGVVFTTIQKFFPDDSEDKHPQLTDRRNVVVIADEAHRGQYNFAANLEKGGDFAYGFAQHIREALPNAAFVGFTGTPVETADKVTTNVFGTVIDTYDIQQAVEDGATVPIYYEARLARIELPEDERPRLDKSFEEVTEGAEDSIKRRLQLKWAALEALVGADKRVKLVAKDIVTHFEERTRALPGKAMVVCMSRRISVALYEQIIALRPEWVGENDTVGRIKVVITGSAADGPEYQAHIRTKAGLTQIAKRFKDPTDPLHLVIVCDMWLTGFDAPCVHTMYLDKPLKAHGLMQAIARVNRVYGVKPSGLVVDYLGLAAELKDALATYTAAGGRGSPTFDQDQAVVVLLERLDVIRAMFHGFDYQSALSGTPVQRLMAVGGATAFLLERGRADAKARLVRAATDLYRAYALAAPADAALAVATEVGFFQAVRAALVKMDPQPPGKVRTAADLDLAVQQLVSRALVSDQVVDIFAVAGLKRPDVSVLSENFLRDVQGMPHKSLAAELLERLLRDEIRGGTRHNVVRAKQFSEVLDDAIHKYQNRSIEAAQVIEQMLELARQIRDAHRRGEDLNLTPEELAFYDSLEVNDSAVSVLGTPVLCEIARELVKAIRSSVTIDWEQKESVRAEIRSRVKRLLKRYGYPPDKQETAVETVLKQAAELCKDWAAA